MASAQELEEYFHRMAEGQFHPDEVDMMVTNKKQKTSSTGLGRSRYSRAMYKVSNMVGAGPVNISRVQQGIDQARQMSRLKRSRSGSRSQSRSRKRRKRSKSSKRRKRRSTKGRKRKRTKGRKRTTRKRKRKTALD